MEQRGVGDRGGGFRHLALLSGRFLMGVPEASTSPCFCTMYHHGLRLGEPDGQVQKTIVADLYLTH